MSTLGAADSFVQLSARCGTHPLSSFDYELFTKDGCGCCVRHCCSGLAEGTS